MINKPMLPVVLLTVTMGLPRTGALAADELPPRALARLGDHGFYHGPGIECAVLSPDGRRIASVAALPSSFRHVSDKDRDLYGRTIVLWDTATGRRVRELLAPHAPISHLAFSLDGRRLAAAYDISAHRSGVVVFEVERGKLLRQFGTFKSVSYLQFSDNGKQLRVSEWRGPVSVWDAATGKRLRLWKPPPTVPPRKEKEGVCGVRGVLSPEGKVIVWEMCRFVEGESPWNAASLRVHDANTDKLLYQKTIELGRSWGSFVFSPDGKRFAADSHKLTLHKLTLWETATGKELLTLDAPEMWRFALAPDWRRAVVVYESDSRARLWDLETRKPWRELSPGFVAMRPYYRETPQVFSADGKTLLVATDSTLRLYDATTGKERGVPGHRAPVTPRFSADGRTLFTSCNERRCSWDVSPGKQPALFAHEPRKAWEIGCMAHSADDRLFLDSSEAQVRVRETTTGRVLSEPKHADRLAFSGWFSPDATRVLLRHLASERHRTEKPLLFRLYDAKTGKLTGEIKPVGEAGDPVFSPDGRLVAWTDRIDAVYLYDTVTGKFVRTLRSSVPLPKGEEKYDHADLLFSAEGEHLIVTVYFFELVAGPEIDLRTTTLPTRVFHVPSGREVRRFYANPERTSRAGEFSCAACSPDGRLLAVAEQECGTIRLIEIASGKVRVELTGHRHGVHGLAFSPDGKTLASGGEDNVVFLWDVTGARTGAAVTGASERELAAWWADLAAEDARRAGAAVASLIRTPGQSVAFLKDRLRPAETADEKRLARLIADLDAGAFQKREAASRELVRLGEQAEAALRRELKDRPPLEVSRRIEDLLDRLGPSPLPPEGLRALRAIEVLEHLGTPGAMRCLEALVKGAPEARQTRDAKAALGRLGCRR